MCHVRFSILDLTVLLVSFQSLCMKLRITATIINIHFMYLHGIGRPLFCQ